MNTETNLFPLLAGLAAMCGAACGPMPASSPAVADLPEAPAKVAFEIGSGLRVAPESRGAMQLTYETATRSQFVDRTTVRTRILGKSGNGGELRLRAVISPDRLPFAGSELLVRRPESHAETMAARLIEIDDRVRRVDGSVELMAAVSSSAMPLVGEAMELAYQTGPERTSLGVPSGAVVHAAKGDFVYEETGGFLRRRRVGVGTVDNGRIEIRSGLQDAARVVVEGARKLWILELALVGGMSKLEDVKETN